MTEKEKPAACPHCGYSGAFDGLGVEYDTAEIIHADGGTSHFKQEWYKFHCSECDNVTAMLEKEVHLGDSDD